MQPHTQNTQVVGYRKSAETHQAGGFSEQRYFLQNAADYFEDESDCRTWPDWYRLECKAVGTIARLGSKEDLDILDVMYKVFYERVVTLEQRLY